MSRSQALRANLSLLTSILICLVAVTSPGCRDSETAGKSEPGTGSSLFSADLAARLQEHGAKTGDVQASLLWNNYNDLDLHVIDPSGEEIFFAHKRARSGGELDVDMNAGGPESDKPVENIYFPRNGAPQGRYRVLVHYFANHGSADPTPFRCEVLVGKAVRKFSGQLSEGEPIRLVYEFDLTAHSPKRQPVSRQKYGLFLPAPIR